MLKRPSTSQRTPASSHPSTRPSATLRPSASSPTSWLLAILFVLCCSPHASAQQQRDLTFDDLKFPIEKDEEFQDEMLTDELREMEGDKIRISGYILPSFRQSGIEKFVLVRDNMECCFGPGALLYDCIIVEMEKGTSIEYTVRPITVEGTFKIKKFKGPDKKIRAIYRLTNTEKE